MFCSLGLFSCQKDKLVPIEQTEPTPTLMSAKGFQQNPRTGFVYTQSNDASGNQVLRFNQNPNGKLEYASAVSSGGNGLSAGLGSQGSVSVDPSHSWLFAVNAGSNSVSSFRINDDGSLTLANTVASHGTRPVSVTAFGNFVYVVNSISSNISGYSMNSFGVMTFISNSDLALSAADAGPAQISFTPNGQKLIITEKNTNKITSYNVSAFGVPALSMSYGSAGTTPFGFDFSGQNIVVTEAAGGTPTASTVSSDGVSGSTSLISGPIATGQTAVCWTTVSSDGRYAYVSNTGSNTKSSFGVSANGTLNLLEKKAASTGTTPTDITFSGNDFYVYNLNSTSHSITQFRKGGNTSLTSIGEYVGLPTYAVGLVAF